MVILSLLIAILIDRSLRQRQRWQSRMLAVSWGRFLHKQARSHAPLQRAISDPAGSVLLWVAPAVILGILLWLQDSALLLLLVNILVLVVTLGCSPQRLLVRDYLHKAHRNNDAGCQQLKAELDAANPDAEATTLGGHLVWLNFRYYFAVCCWFIVFGAPGALLYALVRDSRHAQAQAQTKNASADKAIEAETATIEQNSHFIRILHWLEWVPVRVAGFAYLLVGHFNRALPVWLKGFGKDAELNAGYLQTIAERAEDQAEHEDLTDEPCAMLKLAKRTMTFLLAATAVATLLGWLS
ncbi:regulatory signaling modulator protein AmpE [Aliidiomarina soli]|uniref:Regulatory signaling modulator protein AmpE n=1 Tax=Aliidiomarina soli TaxID=1928574 RepID=A0A432WK53_9GAMM|nr:regulatory signaling modulator protein AmpE [Aliidiomarina soli]RUO34077.1 hypothetical protein CWE14_06460 [Aliidiomarina soli]